MKQAPEKLSPFALAKNTIVTINKTKRQRIIINWRKLNRNNNINMSSMWVNRTRTKQKTAVVSSRRRCSAYWELWLDVLTLRPVGVRGKKGKGSSWHSNHPPSKSTSNLSHYHKILVDFKIMVSRTGCFDMLSIFFVSLLVFLSRVFFL